MINDEGRPARPQGRARDQGRRLEPEHRRLGLQRADQRRQGRPAARHVLVAAEPAGVGGRRARPDALRRARRRQPRHLQPRLQDDLLRPAGDRRPPGRRVGRTTSPRCRRTSGPKTAAYPTLDDPFTTPTSEGIEAILKAGRRRDRLPQDLHGRHEELRLDRQRGQGEEPRPRRRRHAVRGRRRLRARARQGRLHAEVALPDQRAVVRRPVRRGRRRREHRGRLLRGQPQPGVQDPGQRGVRRQVPGDVRRARPCPRTRPTRTPPAQVLQATVEANKTVEKADQLKLADWLRANAVADGPRQR